MIFLYKNYPYSPLATVVSLMLSLAAAGFLLGGVALFVDGIREEEYVRILPALLLFAVGVLVYIFGSVKLSQMIAKKNGKKNIMTKAKYARQFVGEHPEAYDELIQKNPSFAAKYVRNAEGKIVRR